MKSIIRVWLKSISVQINACLWPSGCRLVCYLQDAEHVEVESVGCATELIPVLVKEFKAWWEKKNGKVQSISAVKWIWEMLWTWKTVTGSENRRTLIPQTINIIILLTKVHWGWSSGSWPESRVKLSQEFSNTASSEHQWARRLIQHPGHRIQQFALKRPRYEWHRAVD